MRSMTPFGGPRRPPCGRACASRALPAFVVPAIVLMLFSATSHGATGVPEWNATYRMPTPGGGGPLVARELADGTRMVVVTDARALSAIRYDAAGNQVGVATFYPAFVQTITPGVYKSFPVPPIVAIDPFGAIYVGAVSGLCCSTLYIGGNTWIMKYDGLTGHALWPAPVTWIAPSGRLSAPAQLLVDGAGNLVVSVLSLELQQLGVPDQNTLKYDGATGALLWGPQTIPATSLSTVSIDAAGNAFVVGTNGSGSGGTFAAFRYDTATGALDWGPVPFDGGSSGVSGVSAVDGAGDFVVGGSFNDSTSGFQAIKFDGQTGAIRWGPSRWTAPGGTQGSASALAVSPTGNVFVSGFLNGDTGPVIETVNFAAATGAFRWVAQTPATYSAPTVMAAGNGDAIVTFPGPDQQGNVGACRYSSVDGRPVWGPVEFPGTAGWGAAPVSFVSASGRLFIAAYGQSGSNYGLLAGELLGASGSFAWGPSLYAANGGGSAQLNEIAVTPDGNLVVTGWVTQPTGYQTWATLKYDRATGNVLWGPVFLDTGSFGGLSPWGVVSDAAGDVFVGGYVMTPDSLRLAAVKYSGATGQALWTNAIVTDLQPYGLAVDGSGNLLVVGQLYNQTYDAELVKFSGSNGQLLWGPVVFDSGFDDYPYTLSVDAAGNAILIGGSFDPMTGIEHWFTWKASGADGHAIWGPNFDSGQYGTAEHAAIDAAGDVVVTGLSDSQMKTVKYRGTDGATLWGPMVVTGPEADAGGLWVAVDGNGDAIATGTSYSLFNGVYDADFVTIKYRGSDGATLWGPTYFDDPSHHNDYVYGVVLDAAGNPVVSGYSETATPTIFRIATLKYDGATGNVLWGPVLTSPPGNTYLDGLAASGNRIFLGAVSADAYDVTSLTESLGIQTTPEGVAPETCGTASSFSFEASNGAPPYAWSVASGSLPAGLALAADGSVSGTPAAEGSFTADVRVQDSVGASADRSFVFDVGAGPPVPILASSGAGCQVTLSLADAWTSYQWLPNGETTSSISVTPFETTTYGVLLGEADGCVRRGAITITGSALTSPGCLSPTVVSIAPRFGPAAGGTPLKVMGTKFQAGASLTLGGQTAGGVSVVEATEIDAISPALAPGTVADVIVTNPDTSSAGLVRAWLADYGDVPPSNPFHDDVVLVALNGITAGCGAGNYCPATPVPRQQMAVFLLRALLGPDYVPPRAVGLFADVPVWSPFAPWIEDLANRGITGGCGGGNFCPGSPVTRAQMAVFLLKTLLGSSYVPPVVAQIFQDVPPGSFAADWINDLYDRGVTGGCSASPPLYCPASSSTRGQMAVFLAKTFNLQ